MQVEPNSSNLDRQQAPPTPGMHRTSLPSLLLPRTPEASSGFHRAVVRNCPTTEPAPPPWR